MSANKRIDDLNQFKYVLPYASEMFGVYQPMIGWKSKRITQHMQQGIIDSQSSLLQSFAKNYKGVLDVDFGKTDNDVADCNAKDIKIKLGKLNSMELNQNNDSVLLQSIIKLLPKDEPPKSEKWEEYINPVTLQKILDTTVSDEYTKNYKRDCLLLDNHMRKVGNPLIINTANNMKAESAIAGALLGMFGHKMYSTLEDIFYNKPDIDLELANHQIAQMLNDDDPFATFNPNKDISNVCLSPLGIVHLFRQFFFEFDTFLATPTGHVWLSPGSMVELIEVSTRRTYIEKTTEFSTETTTKTETSTTDKDEISEAVKNDNKTDLKLGATATVNQSWGTGNATATGSINKDTTQQIARETTHKRMREQTAKLSTEIKQNYKSTFKTITEVTDTSSKRYVLNNTTQDLINYELRRKMRQVGVQVQDIGTYLCWETFVDEPGKQLGLANLVNIAQPADLQPEPPDPTMIPQFQRKTEPFTTKAIWNTGDVYVNNGPDGFYSLGSPFELPVLPEGYEITNGDADIDVWQIHGTGTDFTGVWAFKGKLHGGTHLDLGVLITQQPDGIRWKYLIEFEVGFVINYDPTAQKRKEIEDANSATLKAGNAASIETKQKTKDAFYKSVKDRIDLASKINSRKYEDLREEERIIVYRNLIRALLSDTLYNMSETTDNNHNRHTLSELLNSIFDIDKMLYFVAPEWWKPRIHEHQNIGTPPPDEIKPSIKQNTGSSLSKGLMKASITNDFIAGRIRPNQLSDDYIVNWSDLDKRADNYYITENSNYAKMGSSLGWLLQLDGDDMRNAFLNAPWVKAVIPIRPGKELEATNWLTQMNVEGATGLGDDYASGTTEELKKIKAALSIPATTNVTIGDAIKYLCAEVAQKHKESTELKGYKYENGEEKEMASNDTLINDVNTVSAIPIDKVYEHGFYPLKGGFRATTPGNFKVFSQWIEVLPTDQVVPVEVKYESKTGKQMP